MLYNLDKLLPYMKQPHLPRFTEKEAEERLDRERSREYRYDVSLVMSVLDSHEVLRRQILFWSKHVFSDDQDLKGRCQIVVADDMSDPPLESVFEENRRAVNFDYVVFRTESEIPWTQMLGANMGAERAEGRYVLHTAIDHMVSKEAFRAVADFQGDKMQFRRAWGVLDEQGDILIDHDTLVQYGWKPSDRVKLPDAQDQYAMKRWIYLEIGGYNPRHFGHYFGDVEFHWEYAYFRRRMLEKIGRHKRGPMTHCFAGSMSNPLGLFHKMPRKGGHIKELTEQIRAGKARKGGYGRAAA